MVKVRIPTPLRRITSGASEVEVDGGTVRDVVAQLEAKYPGMKERLCDDAGELRRFVNVYVGDEDVRFLEGLDTKVTEGTLVSIIPAVAGGAWEAQASGVSRLPIVNGRFRPKP